MNFDFMDGVKLTEGHLRDPVDLVLSLLEFGFAVIGVIACAVGNFEWGAAYAFITAILLKARIMRLV